MSEANTAPNVPKAAEEPKKVWNSLEISKLAVGALTPVMVLALGWNVTRGAEQRSLERTKAAEVRANDREDQAKKRDEAFRLAAEARDAVRAKAAEDASRDLTKQMADLAAEREALLSAQDADRQAVLRRRAEARDDYVRAQTAELERKNRIVERRSAIWDQLGPKLNDIYAYIARVGNYKEFKAAQVVQLKRDCDKIFYSYQPFFSDSFVGSYNSFMAAAFETHTAEGADALIRTTATGRGDPDDFRFALSGSLNDMRAASDVLEAYRGIMIASAADLGLDRPVSGFAARVRPAQ